jgi:hypothetical protein
VKEKKKNEAQNVAANEKKLAKAEKDALRIRDRKGRTGEENNRKKRVRVRPTRKGEYNTRFEESFENGKAEGKAEAEKEMAEKVAEAEESFKKGKAEGKAEAEKRMAEKVAEAELRGKAEGFKEGVDETWEKYDADELFKPLYKYY